MLLKGELRRKLVVLIKLRISSEQGDLLFTILIRDSRGDPLIWSWSQCPPSRDDRTSVQTEIGVYTSNHGCTYLNGPRVTRVEYLSELDYNWPLVNTVRFPCSEVFMYVSRPELLTYVVLHAVRLERGKIRVKVKSSGQFPDFTFSLLRTPVTYTLS